MNAEGRLRGLSDPPLDKVGVTEAAQLAEALASVDPTVVICSPFQRAVATARAIGAACGAPVRVHVERCPADVGRSPGPASPKEMSGSRACSRLNTGLMRSWRST